VLSCVGRGLTTGRSPFQWVLPSIQKQGSKTLSISVIVSVRTVEPHGKKEFVWVFRIALTTYRTYTNQHWISQTVFVKSNNEFLPSQLDSFGYQTCWPIATGKAHFPCISTFRILCTKKVWKWILIICTVQKNKHHSPSWYTQWKITFSGVMDRLEKLWHT
jgi:hypothetical protein